MPEKRTGVGEYELQSLLGRDSRASVGATATATVSPVFVWALLIVCAQISIYHHH